MKTYKGLYERIVTFENLHAAFRKAAKGKGLRADCAAFAYGREREILLLQEELTCGTCRHGPYREFTVRDPKVREVKAARGPWRRFRPAAAKSGALRAGTP